MLTRFIFLSVSLIFIAAGVYALFFMDVDEDMKTLAKRDIQFNKDDPRTYPNLINKNGWAVKSVLSSAAEECNENNKQCVILKTFWYLQNDIVQGEYETQYLPDKVLRSKTANDLDLSILYASLLSAANIPTYLAFKDNKSFIYACKVSPDAILREIAWYIDSSPLLNRTMTLDEDKEYLVGMDKNSRGRTSRIKANGSGSFDLLMLPSIAEFNLYKSGKEYSIFTECSMMDTENVDIKCTIPKGATLAIVSHEMNNILSFSISHEAVEKEDISPVEIDGSSCIPLDPYRERYPAMFSTSQDSVKVLKNNLENGLKDRQ